MDDLEDRLQRYRPVGPPAELRARVVASAVTTAPRRWVWVPSAAAAATACMFYLLAADARRDLAAELAKADPSREATILALAADLGGDEEARKMAVRLVELNEAMAAAASDPRAPLDVESNRHD